MFRLWIERRFSRPVTAAGTVRIGRSAALCGAAAIIYVRQHRIILSAAPAGIVRCCRKKKGPLMKHSSLPRRILLVLAGTLALPALAVGQYLHDYCHTD